MLIRWGGSRAVASLTFKIVVILLLVVGVPLAAFWPFGKTHAPSVEVYDEAGVLQEDETASALEELRFRQDVKLVVLTLDAGYNDNFNSEVLAYARKNHPEWISASDPNYWADGLVVLGVSPRGRWAGCYFGEDVKVDLAVQRDIQDAGKASFREKRWAFGVWQMARQASAVMGRPVPSTVAGLIISCVGVTVGVVMAGVMLVRRHDARSTFARARRHYTQVTADYDATQIKAGLIPTDDAHGAQVLARFAWFEDRYAELTLAIREVREPARGPVVLLGPQAGRRETPGSSRRTRLPGRRHRQRLRPADHVRGLAGGLAQRAGAGPGGPGLLQEAVLLCPGQGPR